MELEITKKQLNPLLSRIEVEGIAVSDITPSYEEVKKELSEKMNKDSGLIIIKNVYQKYGELKSVIRAFIYESKESMDKFERVKKVKQEEKKAENVPEQKK